MPATETTDQNQSSPSTITNEQLAGFEYRNVGPHKGGRVVAVAGHPEDPKTFYFGACAGGIWKSNDGGTYWENCSDGYLTTAAIGALAIAPSDPNVLYAGTGETTIRSNVSHGDGVYRSTDGGKSWRNVGLTETRHIARIRIHPQDPKVVYVAALGHAWGPNPERGIYRSTDGGENWKQILFRDEHSGAIDLSLDPHNPRILYAAFWDAHRTRYGFSSGGPGSSLYRSTDGGDTWTEITRNEGLPKGVLGKIGVAVSPARPNRVWALIEAEDGALFRSDDGGDTWKRINENADLRRRAWYYMHIFADPQDAETVWVLNLQAWKSVDGGKTFSAVPTPHGDNHELWIDPQNPLRMIEGNDGGACVSFNGGASWSSILNQPTAQFYHVTTDNQVPYRLYGSQQDNSAISVPSQSIDGAITSMEWFEPGGGESGYIAVRPDNPDIQYAGDHRGMLTRHDRRTAQQRIINVWPDLNGMHEGAESLKYRFQWTFPIFISPHDPNVLYTAANHLFRSTDEGTTWEVISPDLTRNDPSTLGPAGGPITRDNTSAEVYATIFAAVESPHEQGVFWAGTDDGLVHLSLDGAKTWSNVTPPDLPEWALISIIEVSPHDAGTAYIAATRYKLQDNRPYLYKTSDYGKTWQKITNGIPEDDFTRVIREDPGRQGLLYAGTETGLYISFDDGGSWEALQTNLPVCPIHDLVLKDNDLVVGTHGRSFWILDDVTPLHAIATNRAAENRLFKPRDTVRFKIYEGFGSGEGAGTLYRMAGPVTYAYRQEEKPDGTKETKPLDAGKNRPNGVSITYFLAEKPQDEISLTILDSNGNKVREFSSKKEKPEEKEQTPAPGAEAASPAADMVRQEAAEGSQVIVDPEVDAEEQGPFVPKNPGINRFTWNFRYENATKIPGDRFSEFATAGPPVPPGTYQVQLKVGEQTFTESFQILKDPRIEVSQEDLQAQYELGMKIRDTMSRINEAVIQIRDLREQLDGWEKRLARQSGAEGARKTAGDLKKELTSIEEEFMNTKSTSRMQYPPPNVPTRLNQRLMMLAGCVDSADAAPTRAEYDVFDTISQQVNAQLDRLEKVLSQGVPSFNNAVQQLQVPALVTGESKVPAAAAS